MQRIDIRKQSDDEQGIKKLWPKETFNKILFQNKILHPNIGQMTLDVSQTESWPHFTTQFEVPQRATRSTKTVCSFLILIFNQYAYTKFFY